MFTKYGWAAFLASVVVASVSGGPAAAAAPRPTFACFKPSNANLIGRLGPNDQSVRQAFEAGACLALPAGVVVSNAQHSGALWQFQALGGGPSLYAPEWGAGFAGSGDDQMIAAFSTYLPVTGRLLDTGYGYADCYDASERLSERWRDLDRRWKEYQNRGNTYYTRNAMKVVMYVGDEAPRLAAEGDRIQREGQALDSRCARYEAVVTDRDFMTFIRSTRRA